MNQFLVENSFRAYPFRMDSRPAVLIDSVEVKIPDDFIVDLSISVPSFINYDFTDPITLKRISLATGTFIELKFGNAVWEDTVEVPTSTTRFSTVYSRYIAVTVADVRKLLTVLSAGTIYTVLYGEVLPTRVNILSKGLQSITVYKQTQSLATKDIPVEFRYSDVVNPYIDIKTTSTITTITPNADGVISITSGTLIDVGANIEANAITLTTNTNCVEDKPEINNAIKNINGVTAEHITLESRTPHVIVSLNNVTVIETATDDTILDVICEKNL